MLVAGKENKELGVYKKSRLRKRHEVGLFLLKGYSNKEIAEQLDIKVATVKWHLGFLYKEYNCKSDREFIVKNRKDDIYEKNVNICLR